MRVSRAFMVAFVWALVGCGSEKHASPWPDTTPAGEPLPAACADVSHPASGAMRSLGPADYGTAKFGPCGDLLWRTLDDTRRLATPELAAGVEAWSQATGERFSLDGRFLESWAPSEFEHRPLRGAGLTETTIVDGPSPQEVARAGELLIDGTSQPWICAGDRRGVGIVFTSPSPGAPSSMAALAPDCNSVVPARTQLRAVAVLADGTGRIYEPAEGASDASVGRQPGGVPIENPEAGAPTGSVVTIAEPSPADLSPPYGPDGFDFNVLGWGPDDAAVFVENHVQDTQGGDVVYDLSTGAVAIFDLSGQAIARVAVDAWALNLNNDPRGMSPDDGYSVTDGQAPWETVRAWPTATGDTLVLHADGHVETVQHIAVVRIGAGGDMIVGLSTGADGVKTLSRWRRDSGVIETLGAEPLSLATDASLETVLSVTRAQAESHGTQPRSTVTRYFDGRVDTLGTYEGWGTALWADADGRALFGPKGDNGDLRIFQVEPDAALTREAALDGVWTVQPVAKGLFITSYAGGLMRLFLYAPASHRLRRMLEGGDLEAIVDASGTRVAATGFTAHRTYHGGDDRLFVGALDFVE